jgi:hypothetical protein
MNMNKMNPDQLFAQLLQNDHVGQPDQSVEDRLMYSYLLKKERSKVRQNSFVAFFGWIFSGQGLGLKAAMVSVVLFLAFFNSPNLSESGKISAADSILTQRILLADTAHFIYLVDSLRVDSLY